MNKAENVFNKLAYGPVVNRVFVDKAQRGNTSGFMVHPSNVSKVDPEIREDIFMTIFDKKKRKLAKKKGFIQVGPGLDLPWTRKSDPTKHELVHWLRAEKGKWSAKNYNKLPGKLIEEFAAYHRAGESTPRSIQGAVGSAIIHGKGKISNLARKLMFRKLK